MTDFDTSLDFIWGPSRDGQPDDSAPGETFRTSYGVTASTWAYAVDHGIVTGNIEDATRDQCGAIFRAFYWNAMHCSSLPAGVDLLLFEQATLGGTGIVVRIMQGIIGAEADGVVGPETLRLAGSHNVRDMIDRQVQTFLVHLSTLGNWQTFQRGWTNREVAAKAAAYKLARITP